MAGPESTATGSRHQTGRKRARADMGSFQFQDSPGNKRECGGQEGSCNADRTLVGVLRKIGLRRAAPRHIPYTMTQTTRIMVIGLVLSGWLGLARGEEGYYRAVEDFKPVKGEGVAEYYVEAKMVDPEEHGLAVNPKRFGEGMAGGEMVYAGPEGIFDVELVAVAEEDGESVYELEVGGKKLGERVNPETAEKRRVVRHRWAGVKLKPGDRIRVWFGGRTNGKIPEGDGTAWSRGRWRGLEIKAAPGSAG